MKDGDVSLIVKNVNINDTGTYECRVRYSNTQPPPQLITNLLLTVTDSGQKAGRTEDGGEKDGRNKDGGDKDGGKDGGKDVGDKGGGDKDGDASGLVVCLLCVNVLLIDAVIVFMILKWKDLKCFRSLPNPLVKPH
ncbi:hypothetical protein Q5P01_003032 [Channa striata]|uniref:Immunoglobulin V-set domain-containing protein n=1 Tax=Channa striata TaxID=64152 RepID=A0AA88NVB5_CHASR|nr:hypothetical protein Q5P01_003032 [Channa striata]